MAKGDHSQGIYDHLYRRFFANKDRHPGYDFQRAPGGSAQPPTVTFKDKLRWWSLDRWRRRKKILSERDRLQREIVEMRAGRSKERRR
ncbi:MAG TPA: hypothetical protein VFQ02_10050 [Nitrospira sp.]|nr:hypothetical protein [Nitrospira sp.]